METVGTCCRELGWSCESVGDGGEHHVGHIAVRLVCTQKRVASTTADRGGIMPRLRLRPACHAGEMPRMRSGASQAGGHRQLRHWLLILIAATSLIFFAATAIMALRSAMKEDTLHRWVYIQDATGGTYGQDGFASYGGRLDYQGFRYRGRPFAGNGEPYSTEARFGWSYSAREPVNNLYIWLSPFTFDRRISPDGRRTDLWIYIAYWPPLLICGLVAWWSVARLRRLRRVERNGFCRVCGYDLRATPERCPECGAVVTPNQTVDAER
jgi:hypothetical protein